jgi:hypothetical protein
MVNSLSQFITIVRIIIFQLANNKIVTWKQFDDETGKH